MVTITLPNQLKKNYDKPVTVQAVAEEIGPRLAKATLAGKVNNQLVDASYYINEDAELTLITAKDKEGLEIIRHSAAHLLAHAVKMLYPSAMVAIGPVIEDGFYYDFAVDRSFTPEDVEKIELKMKELVKADLSVERMVLTREQAITLFSQRKEQYKLQIIESLPANELITAYRQGDFIDLCRGPHVPRTGLLKAFKLTKLAGAYWKGDASNEMLQRIYGTAWSDQEALSTYLKRLEEAEKRDHRVLAKKMNLFHFQPEAPGCVFWHPKGWVIVRQIQGYIRQLTERYGYQEVNTPQLIDISLWERSGHLAKFDDDIFTSASENREYAIKPMNCPAHVQIFKQGIKSYRDLPIRYSEFGACYRNEPSGTLHGLMRLRGFVQDDGHIFCDESQVKAEVLASIKQIHEMYARFGFVDLIHKISTRPEKRVGSDETWDKAELALKEALNSAGIEWDILPGEGAFYGPKIEFSLKDCIGRVWQCGTIQVDFSTAFRLGATYVTERGDKKSPIMIHRAMLGSIERFLGILLEEHAGQLPLWLAPIQVVCMGVADRHHDYVSEVVKYLKDQHIRAVSDLRNEKIGFKIREHTIARVPYQVVVGDREMADNTLSVRLIGEKMATLQTREGLAKQLKQLAQQ